MLKISDTPVEKRMMPPLAVPLESNASKLSLSGSHRCRGERFANHSQWKGKHRRSKKHLVWKERSRQFHVGATFNQLLEIPITVEGGTGKLWLSTVGMRSDPRQSLPPHNLEDCPTKYR